MSKNTIFGVTTGSLNNGGSFKTAVAHSDNEALLATMRSALSASKTALQAVAADGAYASLAPATKTKVTGTVSGALSVTY